MRGLLEAGLLLLLVLAEGQRGHPRENDVDRGKESFLIRYKNGEEIVPVSVRLDYRKGTEYVLSLSPRSKEKAVTLYDFNMRVIAFKHMASQNCFIMRMRHESIDKELRILDSFKNEIISGTKPVVLYASRESLHPAALNSIAGAKVARFCHRSKAYLITSHKHKKRPKRNAEDYTQRTYGHFGQQSQSYSHYGQDTVTNGKGQPPSFPALNSRGSPPLNPSDPRTGSPGGFPGGSYSFQGNQRSGYEIYQPFGPNGGLRSYGELGAGFGQIPGFTGDPRQLAAQMALPPGMQPFSSQEQVLRFPLQPSQNGNAIDSPDHRTQDIRAQNQRAYDSRNQDPRFQDSRIQDPRSQNQGHDDSGLKDVRQRDPRLRDQRVDDPRSQDPRSYDPRYRQTDPRLPNPYQSPSDRTGTTGRDSSYNEDSRTRGAATDTDSGALAQGVAGDSNRWDLPSPLVFRNMTFDSFDTGPALSNTGVLSNTKVTVDLAGTNAVASSQGQLNDQRSQSQVQGTYAGAGSFSAQAQSGFLHGTTQSQVRGGSDGGSSISSANVERLGSAQSQVQVGTPDGKSSGSAQGNFVRGGTQAEAQGSRDSGTASSQAQSPGLSQSSATVNARGTGPPREKYLGEVSASSRGDPSSGVSSTNLQGAYGADNAYSARAEGSFNSQSNYSPLSGLPPSPGFVDSTGTTSDSRRGDILPDYRYPTRSPYDVRGNQSYPDYRYPTTSSPQSPYDQQSRDRTRPDPRYTTTLSPYDQQSRDRLRPDYRYTTTTTQTPYVYPTRDRGDPRTREPDGRLPGQDVRRSGVSPNDGTYYYPTPSTHVSQAKGDRAPDPYEQRRQNIFPPYSPDPRLANKGPSGPPPFTYDDRRRAYVIPSQHKPGTADPPSRAYLFPEARRQPASSQTKSQISYANPQRAYVFPDPGQHPPSSQTKSQITYPTRPTRAYVFPDPSQQQIPSETKSQISYPTRPTRAYVFPDPSQQQPSSQTKSQVSYPAARYGAAVHPHLNQEPVVQYSREPLPPQPLNQPNPPSAQNHVSCCRTRPEQFQQCCQRVPHAECCSDRQRDEQTRSRRYLSDQPREDVNKCQPTCYTVYKTIGQAKICQPNFQKNC